MGNCIGVRQSSNPNIDSTQHIDKIFSIDATSLDEVECASPQKVGQKQDNEDMINLVFQIFDKNKSNFLEMDQIYSMLVYLQNANKTGLKITMQKVRKLLDNAKAEHQDKISKAELANYYQSLL